VQRLGRADFEGFASDPELGELMKHAWVAHLEMVFRAARAASAEAKQLRYTLIIVDVVGITLRSLRHGMPLIRYCSEVGLANFPEGTDRIFVVNAPSIIAAMVCTLPAASLIQLASRVLSSVTPLAVESSGADPTRSDAEEDQHCKLFGDSRNSHQRDRPVGASEVFRRREARGAITHDARAPSESLISVQARTPR